MTSDYQRDTVRMELLLSGRSELGRSEAAWLEADEIARHIAERGGLVEIPEEIKDWLLDEPVPEDRLEKLVASPLRMRALPTEVRKWIDSSIVAMRLRQRGE